MTRSVRALVGKRTRLRGHLRTAEGERGLEFERLRGIGRESLAQAVDLGLHLGHGPGWSACFEDTHVSYEEISSIPVDIWIRAGNCNLDCQRTQGMLQQKAYQVEHRARQDCIYGEAHASQHTQQARHPVGFQNCLLQLAHCLGSRVAGHHVLFPDPII